VDFFWGELGELPPLRAVGPEKSSSLIHWETLEGALQHSTECI
jgi:hypothetical protein